MTENRARRHRTMVEREAELATVDEALDQLTGPGPDSGGALLAFSGPAGLGKTTLLAEVRRRAHARTCTVLAARGGEQEQGQPFHVARQLIQPQLAGSSEAELHAALGSWYSIVGPALGLCAPEQGAPPDPQGLRDGLDWVLTHLVVKKAPVALVLDDAHWADPESLGWLAAFAPRAEHLPLLLVVAYRPDELPAHAEAFRILPGRAGQRPLSLAPLTAPAVTALVRETLNAHAEDEFCRELWAVTTGNPFEAVELTAKVREKGLAPVGASAPLLRDLAAAQRGSGLVARLDRLGPSTVRFAWACAVLGTAIPRELAARVAALGTEEAADATGRLRDARILAAAAPAEPAAAGFGPAEEPEAGLEFVHPLIATALYRSIPDALRVALHGKAAAAVVDAGLGSSAAARHLLETHPENDPWVVRTLREAAAENLRAGAPEAARRQLARALREPPDFDERAAVLYELGCASLLTEPANTVNHLQAALAEPVEDPALRQGIVIRLAQVLAHSDHLAEASQALAREIPHTADVRARLRLQSEQFMWDAFNAAETDSPARSRRLAKLADRLTGRDLTERYIIGLRTWDACLRGEPVDVVLHHAERALQQHFSWAYEDRGFEVPVLTAMVHMYADRPWRAEQLFDAGTAEFERHGWRGAHLSFAYSLRAYIRYRRGRLLEAEELARAGLRLAERVGRRTPVHWYAIAILVTTLLARGRTDEAWELAQEHEYREPFPAAVVFPDSQTVYAELLLARGDLKGATAELEAVDRRLTPRGIQNPAWCPWQLHLARAVAAQDPGRARDLAADAVRRARAFGAASGIGQALRVAAEVAAPEDRAGLLREAVTLLAASPAGYELARAQAALGSELRDADLLERAVLTARECGADALEAEATVALLALGGVLPCGSAAAAQGLTADGLTAEELRAAQRADARDAAAASAGRPAATCTAATHPAAPRPDPNRPDPNRPAPADPRAADPDPAGPDAAGPHQAGPDAAPPGPARPDPAQPGPPPADPADAARQEAAPGVTEPDWHLSAACRKLGTDRSGLPTALAGTVRG
ncbi:AAA family ATPase [Streptomyces xanthophaeus]|uniref:ATP-binding protein n=1 Tax=Streptomyces xanthophaeus TaxID=67385 RepID=UPI003869B0D9|nr:AAA family ATPase [Streptomyces xanthophaeus]WST64064.1 AAA family ATPase [Streptomyces xanthophaeus]